MQIHPPIAKLDDSVAEGVLVSTAQALCDRRRRSAVAELVLMGINRIVVTNGSIEAKLLFDVHGG